VGWLGRHLKGSCASLGSYVSEKLVVVMFAVSRVLGRLDMGPANVAIVVSVSF